jgi:hypothetical protein
MRLPAFSVWIHNAGMRALIVVMSLLLFACSTETVTYVTTGGTTGSAATTGGAATAGGATGTDDGGTGGDEGAATTGGETAGGGSTTGGGVTEIPTTTGEGCGEIKAAGCCDGEILKYCIAGELQAYDCRVGKPPHCGWDVDSDSCENEGGADPSGKSPQACP